MTDHDLEDWSVYRHAYGPASDIPHLLPSAEQAASNREFGSEPWHSLWSALCHQDSVYPASYRAPPDLVRIARARADSVRSEALLLAAAIFVCSHHSNAPPIPVTLRSAVERARLEAQSLLRAGPRPSHPLHARIHAIAHAAFSGSIATARAMLDEDDGALQTGPA